MPGRREQAANTTEVPESLCGSGTDMPGRLAGRREQAANTTEVPESLCGNGTDIQGGMI